MKRVETNSLENQNHHFRTSFPSAAEAVSLISTTGVWFWFMSLHKISMLLLHQIGEYFSHYRPLLGDGTNAAST